MLIPPLPWDREILHEAPGDEVILLHGLWRSVRSLEPLARRLNVVGFQTLNVPYASMRRNLEALADDVAAVLERRGSRERTLHFVTHSMGGIVARHLLAAHPSIRERTRRAVMLAAPNVGSEIVEWAEESPLFRLAMGPAGCSLTAEALLTRIPPMPDEIETGVLMGRRGTIPFFRRLFPGDHDGIVGVERGRMRGLRDFGIVDADHTFIAAEAETQKQVVRFLKSGTFGSETEADDLGLSKPSCPGP